MNKPYKVESAIEGRVVDKMTLPIMEITPEQAEVWLERNVSNRTVRDNKVERYAAAMKRGEWRSTREPIEFDVHGNLVNGQHRLYAIVFSGVTITNPVRFGATDYEIAVMDNGMSRTAGDLLAIRGKKNTTTLAAAAKFYYMHNHYPSLNMSRGGSSIMSNELVQEIVEANPNLTDSVEYIRSISTGYSLLTPSSMSAIHYEIREKYGVEMANEYFSKVIKGYDLSMTDPIIALRNALERARSKISAPVKTEIKVAWLIIAFNKWRMKIPLRQMKISHQSMRNNYPTIE